MPSRYKVSFYCDESQLGDLVSKFGAVTCRMAEDKGNPHKPPGPSYMGPCSNAGLAKSEPFTLPAPHSETRVAGRVSQSEPGRVVLRLFDDLTVAHPVDICTALKKAGYAPTSYGAICAGLIREGMLYRSTRGAYRRPTSLEQAKT